MHMTKEKQQKRFFLNAESGVKPATMNLKDLNPRVQVIACAIILLLLGFRGYLVTQMLGF